MLIGFTGKKQSGKTTATAVLVKHGYTPIAFSAPMKSFITLLLLDCGSTPQEIDFYMQNKEVVIPTLGVTMRVILQTLGTDWGRNLIHEDLWIFPAQRQLDALIESGSDVVIEDIRFENEAKFVRDNGGHVVHIHRETGYADVHVSESGIAQYSQDLMIANVGIERKEFEHRVRVAAGVRKEEINDVDIEYLVEYFQSGMRIDLIEKTSAKSVDEATELALSKAPRMADSFKVMRCVCEGSLRNG